MGDDELLYCFLNFPEVTPDKQFVLDFRTMADEQTIDPAVQHLLQKGTCEKVPIHRVLPKIPTTSQTTIIVKVNKNSPNDRPKAVMPQLMVDRVIGFYHQVLGHGGEQRVHNAIAMHFTANVLESRVIELTSQCNNCQRCKQQNRQHGKLPELPERQAQLTPWSHIAVDLIGPWKWIDARTGVKHKFTALTVVDTVTSYCEIIRLDNKTPEHVAMQFEKQLASSLS